MYTAHHFMDEFTFFNLYLHNILTISIYDNTSSNFDNAFLLLLLADPNASSDG